MVAERPRLQPFDDPSDVGKGFSFDGTDLVPAAAGGSQLAASGWTKSGDNKRGIPGQSHVGPKDPATIGLTADRLCMFFAALESPITITRVSAEVTSAVAGSLVVGVYNASCTDGFPYPTSRIATFGTMSTGTTGVKEVTGLSQALDAGFYAFVYNTNATATLRAGLYMQVTSTMWADSGSSNICRATVFEYTASTYNATLPDPFPAGPQSFAITASGGAATYFPLAYEWT